MTQRGKKSRGHRRNWEAKWLERFIESDSGGNKDRNALSIEIEQLILEIY